ncbi:crosslink repair DNA glycosylase YcaQ family protein [Streptomyces solisilvae]|uniref:DNA glycosylase AlkZ-like family protein n=1 Tax=Streptomyces malaysiensis TaxID=92644 RepID=UPI00332EDABD
MPHCAAKSCVPCAPTTSTRLTEPLRVRAETTKDRPECVVPHSAPTGVLLSGYLAHRAKISRARGPLFLPESRCNYAQPLSLWTWSKVVRRIGLAADVPRFSTHTTRHLCLTDLARMGWELHAIATFAGHRNTDSTRHRHVADPHGHRLHQQPSRGHLGHRRPTHHRPPRLFLPAFDKAVLGYHDGTRTIDDTYRGHSAAGERVVLVDGRVAATWTDSTGTSTVTALRTLSPADHAAINEEEALLR